MTEQAEPAPLEPGETFSVGYGNGLSIEVVALGLGKQRKLSKIAQEIVAMESDGRALELFDKTYEALKLCIPDIEEDDGLLDAIDAEMAFEIVTATLGKQRLNEEALKK